VTLDPQARLLLEAGRAAYAAPREAVASSS
jgi:hypothetical protein